MTIQSKTDRPKNLVTYFGGYAGATRDGDHNVHILRDNDSEAFCGCKGHLTYGTPRSIGAAHRRSCETCFRQAQEQRRDG